MNTEHIIIAGGGTMGTSLVQIFAQKGFAVTLYSRRQETLDRSQENIRVNQEALVAQGVVSQEESQTLIKLIAFTNDKACFADADLVIESISEDMDVKKKFWDEISHLVPENAILCTNTSGMSITEMATAVYRPERFTDRKSVV